MKIKEISTRFKNKMQSLEVIVSAIGALMSVGVVIYGVIHLGFRETWPEMVLNLFYLACIVMMVMYYFKRIDSRRFNYLSSVCLGITVLLRDILFPPPLEKYPVRLICLILAVTLLVLFTFFYSRKNWKSYTEGNLRLLYIIDSVLALLYNLVIYFYPVNEYTGYLLTEIWIRPAIIYGLVACFMSESRAKNKEAQQ